MSIGSTLLANGFGSLLSCGGESLTLHGKVFKGLVTLITSERAVSNYDRNKLNFGTRGASVIEITVNDFAPNTIFGSLPAAGEVITGEDMLRHTVSDVVRNGQTAMLYCKVS